MKSNLAGRIYRQLHLLQCRPKSRTQAHRGSDARVLVPVQGGRELLRTAARGFVRQGGRHEGRRVRGPAARRVLLEPGAHVRVTRLLGLQRLLLPITIYRRIGKRFKYCFCLISLFWIYFMTLQHVKRLLVF